MTVPASKKTDRGPVELFLRAVDRKRQRIAIQIPGYNAEFIFTRRGDGSVSIVDKSDRRVINEEVESGKSTLNVHQEVYNYMARWAASILNDKRE